MDKSMSKLLNEKGFGFLGMCKLLKGGIKYVCYVLCILLCVAYSYDHFLIFPPSNAGVEKKNAACLHFACRHKFILSGRTFFAHFCQPGLKSSLTCTQGRLDYWLKTLCTPGRRFGL